MGRDYAGVLGTLAMVTVVTRGLTHGGGVEVTLKSALLCMFLFAAIGWIVGSLAEQAIEEAARHRLNGELRDAVAGVEAAREGKPRQPED
jgi:hypothetical protein